MVFWKSKSTGTSLPPSTASTETLSSSSSQFSTGSYSTNAFRPGWRDPSPVLHLSRTTDADNDRVLGSLGFVPTVFHATRRRLAIRECIRSARYEKGGTRDRQPSLSIENPIQASATSFSCQPVPLPQHVDGWVDHELEQRRRHHAPDHRRCDALHHVSASSLRPEYGQQACEDGGDGHHLRPNALHCALENGLARLLARLRF